MNTTVKNIDLPGKIFTVNNENFLSLALELFRFQYEHNPVYRQYCDLLKIDSNKIITLEEIPFLPMRFFKTHRVMTTGFEAQSVFESSGTTQSANSRHYVKDIGLYEKSFNEAFRIYYGDPAEWCIIALLPSYLERNNSSLVMMADKLIQQSLHPKSGFYLYENEKLAASLLQLEQARQKTLLLGVTFALLDFAQLCPMPLQFTVVMETGGMKGRREEITRQQVHEILCSSFQQKYIHAEYGMTELLSQAYSRGNGIFYSPPWMKILVREEDDPFAVHVAGAPGITNGAVNIIDLANIYSSAFIETEDAAILYPDGSFEILGRLDNTDIRGCSLLAL